MTGKYLIVPTLVAFGILVSACDKPVADTSKVLAVVNGQPITEKEFDYYLQMRNSRQQPVGDGAEEKKAVLQEMIDRALMAQKAADEHLERDPDVALVLARVRENILAQAFVRKTVNDNPVTDEKLRRRFQQELAGMHKTQYRVRHILLKTEAEAKDIIKQIHAGADFAKLAKAKSIDRETGDKGGDLGGWVNQGMVVEEFFNGLRDMKKGEVSSAPVQSQFGWHVIKVEDTRPLELPTEEKFMANPQARADLQRKIQEELISNALKNLKDKAKITTE